MSNLATALPSVSQPATSPRQCLLAGFAGVAWVSLNLLLIWAGVKMQHPGGCSILAGTIDGAVLSVIAVTKIGERLRSAATGLLSGISLSGLHKGANMVTRWTHGLHDLLDNALAALNLTVDEKLHTEIESAVIWIVWVAIFVVLAALIAEWASACLREDCG